ncbi:MAG: TIGR02453 family protein [Devosiaceae bacterium]|nr:TIGR02453 family protein [Devosiaceae bacterium MH13]
MGKKALRFLKALGFHQSREWFHENKPLYEAEVKTPLGDLVEHVYARMEAAGLPMRGTRKTSLYRVNRDVRFSKNKDPYNTHASALLTRTGTKKDQGFVYVHMANERSFIATGFYGLDKDELAAMRAAFHRRSDQLFAILDEIEAAGHTLDMSEGLKRMPRGYEAVEGERLQSLLKLKHHTFVQEIDNSLLTKPQLADAMIELTQQTLPFLSFGWAAIDPVRQTDPTDRKP